MSPLTVIEDLEILEDLAAPLLARVKHMVQQQFSFQGRKKRLHHRIVETISLLPHARHGPTCSQRRLIQAACLWRPTIRMVDHTRWRISPGKSHLQGRQRQIRRQPFSPRPAHHQSRLNDPLGSRVSLAALPAPSEPCMRLSPHTAQAFKLLYPTRWW
jgi:hypothetical protein